MRVASLIAMLAACGTNDSTPRPTTSTAVIAIPVDGMACRRCATRLHDTLAAIDGVVDAEVSLEHKRLVVHFNAGRLSPDTLASAIDASGFKAGSPLGVTP